MIELTRDLNYEKNLRDYLQSRLPDKVYDAHFHINQRAKIPEDKKGYTIYDVYLEFTEACLGKGRLSGGLMMPPPLTEEFVDGDNSYNLDLSAEKGYEAGLLLSPDYGRDKAEKMIDAHPHIRALKPYFSFLPDDVKYESDILDFAPEWMWELANDRELPVILHLSHYNNILSEKANYEQIRYLCKKYPKMKMILAHCALGHHVRKMRMGLEYIKDLDNIYFDCSGTSEPLAIYHCIKEFGVERMMFGGDYNMGSFLGKIVSYGSNFIAFHPSMIAAGDYCPPDYKYQPLDNMTEGMLALFDAADLLDLKRGDIEKLFYTNAKAMFAIK